MAEAQPSTWQIDKQSQIRWINNAAVFLVARMKILIYREVAMRNFPTTFQIRTLWNAATGVSILILGILLVGLIWLVGKLFGYLQPVLVPVLVAGIVAYLLDPVVRRLQKWGLSRLKSVVFVFVAMMITLVLLSAAILPGVNRARALIAQQLSTGKAPTAAQDQPQADGATLPGEPGREATSLSNQLGAFIRDLQAKKKGTMTGWALTEVDDSGRDIGNSAAALPPEPGMEFFWNTRSGRMLYNYKDRIWQWTTTGTSKVFALLGFILGMLMVPVYLFFFLKDSAEIQEHWHKYVPLKASKFKSELVETLQEINGYLISFFRGQVLVAFIDGILVGIALTLFGLPYGFLIGVFMAMLGVIPYIGNIICLIPACVIAWFHAKGETPFGLESMPYTLGVVIIFVAVQQINSLVTAPKIVGDSVGLHPMTVIFSMVFWTVILGGFVGALLAVPLTAAIKVLFRRFIWEKQINTSPAPLSVQNEEQSPDGEMLV